MPFDPVTAGWSPSVPCPLSAHLGAMWERHENGRRAFAFLARPEHANPRGAVHGGVIMSCADDALSQMVAEAVAPDRIATVQLDTHFVGAVRIGDFVQIATEIVRATRSLVFVRADLAVDGQEVAAVHGIWKRLGS